MINNKTKAQKTKQIDKVRIQGKEDEERKETEIVSMERVNIIEQRKIDTK